METDARVVCQMINKVEDAAVCMDSVFHDIWRLLLSLESTKVGYKPREGKGAHVVASFFFFQKGWHL